MITKKESSNFNSSRLGERSIIRNHEKSEEKNSSQNNPNNLKLQQKMIELSIKNILRINKVCKAFYNILSKKANETVQVNK